MKGEGQRGSSRERSRLAKELDAVGSVKIIWHFVINSARRASCLLPEKSAKATLGGRAERSSPRVITRQQSNRTIPLLTRFAYVAIADDRDGRIGALEMREGKGDATSDRKP